MRPAPAVTVIVLAVLAAACGGGAPSGDLGALADQADHVAELIESDQPCRAADALDELGTMADGEVGPEVREAVTVFVASARDSVTCDPAGGPATDPAAPTPDPADDGSARDPKDDRDEDDDGEGDDGDDAPGKSGTRGRGHDDDSDDDD